LSVLAIVKNCKTWPFLNISTNSQMVLLPNKRNSNHLLFSASANEAEQRSPWVYPFCINSIIHLMCSQNTDPTPRSSPKLWVELGNI